jgi:hypothetical protein
LCGSGGFTAAFAAIFGESEDAGYEAIAKGALQFDDLASLQVV